MPAVSRRAYTIQVGASLEVFTTQKAQLSRAREILATWMRETGEKRVGALRSGFVSVGEHTIQLQTFTHPSTVARLLKADQRRELP